MNRKVTIVIFILILYVCCNRIRTDRSSSAIPFEEETGISISDSVFDDMRIAALNELRNEVLVIYGCIDGWSRVNMGPCGRFAKTFREEWNSRFHDSVNIVFLMNLDGTECNHVIVRLPDGNLFDAGLGVVTDSTLHTVMPDNNFEEMTIFNYELLDKRSYWIFR